METEKQIRRKSQYLSRVHRGDRFLKLEITAKKNAEQKEYRRHQLNRWRDLNEIIKKDAQQVFDREMYEAAWCLTNIASGVHAQTMAVVDNGAIPVLAELCVNPDNFELKEQAIWALRNIAGDGIALRDIVLSSGVLKYLVDQIMNSDPLAPLTLLRNTCCAISNLCKGRPSVSFQTTACVLPAMKKIILETKDDEMVGEAVWTLSFIAECGVHAMNEITKLEVIPSIVKHLESSITRASALRFLTIVSTRKHQIETMVACGAIPILKELIQSYDKKHAVMSCLILCNIAADTSQLQVLIDQQIFPELLQISQSVNDPECFGSVQQRAMRAVCSAVHAAPLDQMLYLVEIGCISTLVLALDTNHPMHLSKALGAISNLLMSGVKELTNLQKIMALLKKNGIKSKLERLRTELCDEEVVKEVVSLETSWNFEED